jgi:hypothetical protein
MTERITVARRATVILFLAAFCWSVPPQKAGAASSPVKVEVGVDEKYDDLAIYVINQTTGAVSAKGDFITEPYLTLSYRTSNRFPAKLVFDFTADFYATYSVQNYQVFRFLIEQHVASKTDVTLKYTFIPKIFFGDDVMDASVGLSANGQSHEIHLVQMTVDRDFMPNLNLALSGKYGVRNAEPKFSCRDYTIWGVSVDGSYRPIPATKIITGVAYENDAARGGTNAFPPNNHDNATYNQLSVYTGLTYSIAEDWLIKGRYLHRSWRKPGRHASL